MTGQKRAEDLTGADLETIVAAALKAGDMQMVEAALTRMAVVDPGRAVNVYDDLRVAVRAADILQAAAPKAQRCPFAYFPDDQAHLLLSQRVPAMCGLPEGHDGRHGPREQP